MVLHHPSQTPDHKKLAHTRSDDLLSAILSTKCGSSTASIQIRKTHDPEAFRDWFRCYGALVDGKGIQPSDIYNFDETGFRIGVANSLEEITADLSPIIQRELKHLLQSCASTARCAGSRRSRTHTSSSESTRQGGRHTLQRRGRGGVLYAHEASNMVVDREQD